MLIEKIQLWEDIDYVTLQTYILEYSPELQPERKRPAVIVCPGGAYLGTSDREGEPVAMRFAAQGYHTFVLRYTTFYRNSAENCSEPPIVNPGVVYPQPVFDLAKAVLTVRQNAEGWNIDINQIAVCGFSAGGHLAASLGVHWQDFFLKDKLGVSNELLKPNALILGYPLLDYLSLKQEAAVKADAPTMELWHLSNQAVFGVSEPSDEDLEKLSPSRYVSSLTPPAFLWHTADDPLVYVSNSLNFSHALADHQVPFELHVFESGVHGLSLCDETTAGEEGHINIDCQPWALLAMNWLKKHC